MGSPWPTLLICACYIYGVKFLGPRLMRDRKPFELKNAIIAYNIMQVASSIYIFYIVSKATVKCCFYTSIYSKSSPPSGTISLFP